MKNQQSLFTVIFMAVLMALAVGCGPDRPKQYPVSGTVTVDGKPLTGEFTGDVRLMPVGKGRPASAMLDAQGNFTLGCYDKADGCIPGDYTVEVRVSAPDTAKPYMLRQLVPPKYGSYTTSDIKVTVTPETRQISVPCSWAPEDEKFRKDLIDTRE